MTKTGAPLPRSTPEAQGIPSAAIQAFLEAAEQRECGLHSLMLLRHGAVVAEGWWAPYSPDTPHMLFSLSKSFTATAVGLAVAEGRLSVDDPVLSFFSAEAPRVPGENLAALRVRHLLTMSTGHDHDTTEHLYKRRDGDWARAFLARPVAHAPGTHFLYNTGATYMLSAIVQRVTGQTLLAYLRPRLFEPLGIEGATWETCPRGVNTGGFGLSIKTEDIARFGQLYLQRGVWAGNRLLPESWVADAAARQTANGSNPESDWEQGYGYQFWRCRHGAYRADGAFGQLCVILPGQGAVVAITAGSPDMQAVLNLMWTHLLPALGPAPLPEDEPAHGALTRKLGGLALPPAQGQPIGPMASRVSGKGYAFAGKRQPLQAISFDFGGGEDVCTVRDAWGEHRLTCGQAAWARGTTTWDLTRPPRTATSVPQGQPVAASGAWVAGDTYEMKLIFYATPFCFTLTCGFRRDKLKLKSRMNVSFGPTELPPRTGQRIEAR
jgi:CubicO group peptidase (beta-lactamase class C family)